MNKRVVSWLVSLVIIAVPVVLWIQRDALFDTWRLRNYEPSAEIVKLADVTTMTDDARRLFYVYWPALEDDKSTFNSHCTDSEQTIVLGCYIGHQGIYLYDVPDERLKGVEEVTAAHEMLHAAYDRLSRNERQRIDSLVQQAYSAVTDEQLQKTIESYRQRDPNIVPNELHSILATEVRTLPVELETYYKRYFQDRAAIVKLAESYRQEFTSREQRVEALDKQLSDIKTQIDALNVSLETQQATMKQTFETLQQQKRSGQIDEYNQGVPTYNQMVVRYNADVNRQKSFVEQYNALVEERNSLAVEENELIQALDSRSPIQTQ